LADGFHNNDVDASRHAYVSAIFAIEYGDRRADILGRYPDYALRKINGKLTPVSLPDDSIQNNLG
jgi:hypothetical protein